MAHAAVVAPVAAGDVVINAVVMHTIYALITSSGHGHYWLSESR